MLITHQSAVRVDTVDACLLLGHGGGLQVAFALAFYALLQGNDGFGTVWESMVSLFVMSMGEITIPFSDDE